MEPEINENILRTVQTHAFERLTYAQRETTNLHIDMHIYNAGDVIGPKFQKITASKSTILVFADDEPLANFGHTCRYLMYESKTGNFLNE